MRFRYLAFLTLMSTVSHAQFKPAVVVNGVTYAATANTPEHVTYVQQDFLDFSLAADSFFVDVMTDAQWDLAGDQLVAEGAFWSNGMYYTPDGCQVFVSEDRDKDTGHLLIVRLFGSIDPAE